MVVILIVVRPHRNLQLLKIDLQCYFLYVAVNHANCLLYGCSKVQHPDFPSQSVALTYCWLFSALVNYDCQLMPASSLSRYVQLMLFQFFAITTSFVQLKPVFWLLLLSDVELFQSSALIHLALRLVFSLEEQDLQWLLSIEAASLSTSAKFMFSFVKQQHLFEAICGSVVLH